LIQEIPEDASKIRIMLKKEFPVFAQDLIGIQINNNSFVLNVNPDMVLPVTDKTVFPTTLFVLIHQPKIVTNMKCSNPMTVQKLQPETFVSLLTDPPTHPSWHSQFCLSFH